MIKFTKKEYDIIANHRGIIEPQNESTQELINTPSRYDSRRKVQTNRKELSTLRQEKIAKIQDISKNEVLKKSIDEVKGIARLRSIKNTKKLTKEELIITLLNWESSAAEHNFEKRFKDNNDNDNKNTDDTSDDKIRCKILDIGLILGRLGNIGGINDRKKIKKEVYE